MNGTAGEMASTDPNVIIPQKGLRDRRKFFNSNDIDVRSSLTATYFYMRLLVFVCQLCFNQFDHSTDAFKGLPLPRDEYTFLDYVIRRCFRGFTQWDAAHMLHIAEHGYVLESSLAFFPLFPLTVRYLSYVASPLVYLGVIHMSSVHMVTAFLLNLALGFHITKYLFDCLKAITHSTKQAHIGTLLFVVNPAIIFFTSTYSESMYALLTILGIFSLVRKDISFWSGYFLSLMFFALAYLTRSNGLINLGYVGFYCLLNALFVDAGEKAPPGAKKLVFHANCNAIITNAVLLLAQLAIAVLVITIPVSLYGLYEQSYFCSQGTLSGISPQLSDLAIKIGVATARQTANISWCNASNIIFPSFYSAIQDKYWDVSLFGYWQLKKIPCFLLAAPALVIIICGIRLTLCDLKKMPLVQYLVVGGGMIPYTLHSTFLGLGALLIYNAEVLMRMLFSSSPFPYLVISRWMSDGTPRVRQTDLFEPSHMPFLSYFALRGPIEKVFFFYFMGCVILGSNAHIMGLPFT